MKSYVFPGDIDPAIMAIGAEPIPYMRTQEFSDIVLDSERILLSLIGCKGGRTIIYTGSGTGAMSAVVENYVTTKKKALVIDGGSFGHRWWDLCRYYGVEQIHYEVPFAKDIDYEDLEKTVAEGRPDVFLCQHHETSTGELFNLKKISAICRKYGVSLVVDVISSFLAEELDMDELGIDIAVTSTQKGLNIPPGLSILFFSERLRDYPFAHHGYYWDFEENFSNLRRGQTPYSPATTLYLQLHARLPAVGGEVHQHAVAGGGAQGIHHHHPPVGKFLLHLPGGFHGIQHRRGHAGAEVDVQHVPLREQAAEIFTVLIGVDLGGLGDLPVGDEPVKAPQGLRVAAHVVRVVHPVHGLGVKQHRDPPRLKKGIGHIHGGFAGELIVHWASFLLLI